MAQELAKQVPREEWDKLPPDLLDNLDHYLYGTLKKPPQRSCVRPTARPPGPPMAEDGSGTMEQPPDNLLPLSSKWRATSLKIAESVPAGSVF